LILPPGADLHNHPLVMNGSVFMQVRVACFPLKNYHDLVGLTFIMYSV